MQARRRRNDSTVISGYGHTARLLTTTGNERSSSTHTTRSRRSGVQCTRLRWHFLIDPRQARPLVIAATGFRGGIAAVLMPSADGEA